MAVDQVILAVDVGSSSIRCSSYRIIIKNNENLTVETLDDCCAKQEARTVQPNTGKINLLLSTAISFNDHNDNNDDTRNPNSKTKSLLDQIDACIDDTLTLLRQRSLNLSSPFSVVGIGFSTFVMNLVGVNHDGNVIGEAASMSYACNTTEASEYCRKLKQELDPKLQDALYQSTGAPLHSAYALVQLGEFYSHSGDAREVAKWQTIASICLARWMGISAVSPMLPISWSEASWTGLFNFSTCQYDPMALSMLPESCRRALPRVADFDGTGCIINDGGDDVDNSRLEISTLLQQGIQTLRHADGAPNPYWDRWPELRGRASLLPFPAKGASNVATAGCRLFLGLGDGACANIGSKCSDASRIAVTVGTSAAARVCLPLAAASAVVQQAEEIGNHPDTAKFVVPPGLFCYRINQSHVLLGGALTDGGSVVEWVSQLTNLTTPQALTECMTQVEELLQAEYTRNVVVCSSDTTSAATAMTQNSLTVIPFLGGERSTGFRDGATGAMLGLTRETTPAHLLKACLEGVTLRIHAIVSLIQGVIQQLSVEGSTTPNANVQIVASGKALEVNPTWRQMLADCTGLNVSWDDDAQEGTSRGVALMIAMSSCCWKPNATKSSMPKEDLVSSQLSTPNLSATQGYWKLAGQRQVQLLHAVTPLYSSSIHP